MGDIRKQIRRLEDQVSGYLVTLRDQNRRLTMLEVYYRKVTMEMRGRVEELEVKVKKLEGKE